MRRWVAAGLFCAMLGGLFGIPAAGFANAVEAAPLVTDGSSTDGMIRVYLSSIGGKQAYNLTVSGAYSVGGTSLANGSKVRVEFSGGTVYVTVNGTRTAMGSSVTISRQSGGVKIAESLAPSNVYPGDMRFFYASGKAYIVCYLYIEEYTYGVLPYEMDNSFPLEALKAQAVAARTYAIRAKTSSGNYDVTDTTTHQVFRGVNYAHKRCIQAVDETWGVVLKYGGSYAGAYYSASNGGQTEANQNVWGGSQLGYLTIKDDPYDLANTSAVKKSYLIYSTPQNGSSVSAYAMIRSALASKLGGSADGYTINEVTDVMLHTPRFAAPSKLHSQLRITVAYNGGGSTSVDIPVFKTVESNLGLGINGDNNELYTVQREAKGFRVTARRYGHGVGMSQRGAEEMANQGFSYAQIIGFYYSGVQRVRMSFSTKWPSSTPTPPAVEEAPSTATELSARVELLNADDRLNLRAEADASSTILARLNHGAEVAVLSDDGAWSKVRFGALTGFVSSQYLAVRQAQTPAPGQSGAATVMLSSGSLHLRAEGNAAANSIGSIPGGATVTVVQQGAEWTRVIYNNQTGYVMSSYLTFAPQPEAPSGGDLAVVDLARQSETVNMREQPTAEAPILARLPHGTALTVVERQVGWTKVGYLGTVGYVMNDFIRFTGSGSQPAETTTAEPAPPATLPPTTAQKAVVTVSSGTLNLRSQPNGSAEVVRRVANGTVLTVTQEADGWCAVTYDGVDGYVMRSYLVLEDGGAVSPPVAQATTSPAQPGTWVRTNDGDRVNLRRTASSHSTVLDRIPHGAEVEVIEWGTAWTKVAYKGYTGYVYSVYLAAEKPTGTAESAGSAGAGAFGGQGWVYTGDGGSVHLRRATSVNSDSLALMPFGASVTLLESDGQWRKVIYKGLTGYMLGDYLVFTGQPTADAAATQAPAVSVQPPVAPPVSEGSAYAASVRVGDARTTLLNDGKTTLNSPTATLSLKQEPDDLAKASGVLGQGELVEVYQYCGSDARWVYVRSSSSQGYALRQHFTLNYRIAFVALGDTGSSLSVRSSADAASAAVATLPHGALVTVLSVENGWARIRLGDGTLGFVSGQYLTDL